MPEYELEHFSSYVGTYIDDIITGSMLPYGLRGRIGSESIVNNEWMWASRQSELAYKRAFLYYHAGSTKFVNMFSSREYYFDSYVPSYLEIMSMNGASFVASHVDEDWASTTTEPYLQTILKTYISTDTYTTITGSDSKVISDNMWAFDFPFMNKYVGVRRVAELGNTYVTNKYVQSIIGSEMIWEIASGSNITGSANIIPSFVRSTPAGLMVASCSFDVSCSEGGTPNFGTIACTQQDFIKCYYGFGYRFNQISSGITAAPNFESEWVRGVSIDGWKYGLINGSPLPTKLIYRVGHYGQPRDMLEGRLLTTFIDPITMRKTEGPVQVRFTSGSVDYVTASNPALNTRESGIYDMQCAVGQPFKDV